MSMLKIYKYDNNNENKLMWEWKYVYESRMHVQYVRGLE